MSELGALYMPRPDGARNAAAETGPAVVKSATSGTTIARMRQPGALTPHLLDAKRVVHRMGDDQRLTDIFRELRTRLLPDTGLRNPVILVSGVGPHCGASFVARNLAAAIAMDEERTALLIDCNLRRPSQSAAFDPPAGPGLADFLRSPSMGAQSIIYPTGVPRLRVIPAGTTPRDCGDQLASVRMRTLIAELSNRYADRCLVLDAPLAVGSPEARMLSQRADIVLLVAGAAMHRTEQVMEAASVFDPAKLAGVIFNELP